MIIAAASFRLYIVGPVVGGVIGALAYHRGIGRAVAPESAVADTSTVAAASSSERRPSDG